MYNCLVVCSISHFDHKHNNKLCHKQKWIKIGYKQKKGKVIQKCVDHYFLNVCIYYLEHMVQSVYLVGRAQKFLVFFV